MYVCLVICWTAHCRLESLLFVPAIIVGTINHYHCVLLVMALTLAQGHRVSDKQNLFGSFSPNGSQLTNIKFDITLWQSSLNMLIQLCKETVVIIGLNWLDKQNVKVCLHFDVFQTWCHVNHHQRLHFDTSFSDLSFHLRSQQHETGNSSALVVLHSFYLIFGKFNTLWQHFNVMKLTLVCSCMISMQRKWL